MFLGQELVSKQLKIFDHSVVNQRELTGLIDVRVRILIGHRTVGSPTGVPKPYRTARRFLLDQFGQTANPSGAFADLHRSVRYQRDPSRIVSPVLQASKSIHQNWSGFGLSDITDDSAHKNKRNCILAKIPSTRKPEPSLRLGRSSRSSRSYRSLLRRYWIALRCSVTGVLFL
jgi:hypothetical protein